MIFNRECRVPFVLAARQRAASGLLPGLMRARDRFTACSPSSGVGDYFRFLLHRGVSQPPDPDLDRVWVIVPVTVSRASSAASGRCRPALTGVGAVPCDQSRALTALCSRRIIPPPASAVSPPITARRVRPGQPDFLIAPVPGPCRMRQPWRCAAAVGRQV